MRPSRVIALSLCLAACGGAPQRHTSRSGASAVARAQAAHEYPSPTPPRRVTGGSGSASAAVMAFARAYINWTAGSVAADMRELAAHSLGQARAATALAAAQTASDYELQRGGIANQGTVEALAPLRGATDRYVVVTRELTTATATTAYVGLQAAWHVAVATVTREPMGRWVVSGWQPES